MYIVLTVVIGVAVLLFYFSAYILIFSGLKNDKKVCKKKQNDFVDDNNMQKTPFKPAKSKAEKRVKPEKVKDTKAKDIKKQSTAKDIKKDVKEIKDNKEVKASGNKSKDVIAKPDKRDRASGAQNVVQTSAQSAAQSEKPAAQASQNAVIASTAQTENTTQTQEASLGQLTRKDILKYAKEQMMGVEVVERDSLDYPDILLIEENIFAFVHDNNGQLKIFFHDSVYGNSNSNSFSFIAVSKDSDKGSLFFKLELASEYSRIFSTDEKASWTVGDIAAAIECNAFPPMKS